jgi:hypothetical protein
LLCDILPSTGLSSTEPLGHGVSFIRTHPHQHTYTQNNKL